MPTRVTVWVLLQDEKLSSIHHTRESAESWLAEMGDEAKDRFRIDGPWVVNPWT